MAHAVEIVKGPGKFDLMVSLFDGEGENRRAVDFVLRESDGTERTVPVYVWSAEREGTRDSEQWVLKGLIVGRGDQRFPATYSTRTRKGHYWPESRR